MIHSVRRACGHTEEVDISGSPTQCAQSLKWYRVTICKKCYQEKKFEEEQGNLSEKYEEVEMHYSEYKTDYSEYRYKPGSYNKYTKTIIVYVPQLEKDEKEETHHET